MKPLVFAAPFVIACMSTSAAELPEPCGLLSPADLSALGVPNEAKPSSEKRDSGRYLACKYAIAEGQTPSEHATSATVMLSAMPVDRIRELRAFFAKALSENTESELQAKGEYYLESVMCKVVIAAAVETSQCVGATETTAVGLLLSHPASSGKISYPSLQLRIISELASRVRQRGG
jgi:hypothetical protein